MRHNRVAVIDRELCRPNICGFYLCQRTCPINRSGKDCVTVNDMDKKPNINEEVCISCMMCVKKCPTNAISVVNLPGILNETPIHRYGLNMFSLYRLPIPKRNMVIGLIGPNGVGKTTVLNILSSNLKPNSGLFGKDSDWKSIIERFKGSEIHDYLDRLSREGIKASYKPQHVDMIPKIWKGKVRTLLEKVDEDGGLERIVKSLEIEGILDKEITELSGGELQVMAIAAAILKKADFYFFDEPSSYLDVYERLLVAKEIRKLKDKAVVMVIEHDLAIADYLADFTHILYGEPGVFGIVSKPYAVRNGINTYLEGYIREENMRFREEPIIFSKRARESMKSRIFMEFMEFEKNFEGFSLKTERGNIFKGEIIGILGPNGIGKTTFIRMLAGDLKPDKGGEPILHENNGLKLSYKPQRIIIEDKYKGKSVAEFLEANTSEIDNKRLLRKLGVERLLERVVDSLSGGEMQAAFIAKALMKSHDMLLLDEPSAFLDVEQRLNVAKIIRSHAEGSEIPCFIVDHDLQFIDSISDRIMVFDGKQGKEGHGNSPTSLEDGMNTFLKMLGITFRRDPQTGRPRANKPDSQKDAEQRESGNYYYS